MHKCSLGKNSTFRNQQVPFQLPRMDPVPGSTDHTQGFCSLADFYWADGIGPEIEFIGQHTRALKRNVYLSMWVMHRDELPLPIFPKISVIICSDQILLERPTSRFFKKLNASIIAQNWFNQYWRTPSDVPQQKRYNNFMNINNTLRRAAHTRVIYTSHTFCHYRLVFYCDPFERWCVATIVV